VATRGEDEQKILEELKAQNQEAYTGYLGDVKDAYIQTASTFVSNYGRKAEVTKERLDKEAAVRSAQMYSKLYEPLIDAKDEEIKKLKHLVRQHKNKELSVLNETYLEQIKKLTAENERMASEMHGYLDRGKAAGKQEMEGLVDSLRRNLATEQKNLENIQNILREKSVRLDEAEKELAVLRSRDLGVSRAEFDRVSVEVKTLQEQRSHYQLENQRQQRIIESFQDNGAKKLADAESRLADYCNSVRCLETENRILLEKQTDASKIKAELDAVSSKLAEKDEKLRAAAEEVSRFCCYIQDHLPISFSQ
jgi:hypothetical protein